VRKMKALPVMMETETMIGKINSICVLTDIGSKIYFIGRFLTFWVLS